jgi:N,N'-diacetylbacillosaminyl-diphospho-undecaprenol alpha-1,3-N-acetylgalactosaminyltransferase
LTTQFQNQPSGLPSRIALVANQDEILYRFRMPIVRELVGRGVEVFAITPPGAYIDRIEANGAKFIPWHVSRSGRNPIAELASIARLAGILRTTRPGIVQSFHAKPNIYAPIAARIARVPVVVESVTGLGYVFTDGGGTGRAALKRLMFLLYRLSGALSSKVTFQNTDDIEILRTGHGIVSRKTQFIPGGSGVELDVFNPDAFSDDQRREMRASCGIDPEAPVVLMVGRLLLDKGVREFAEAARLVKSTWPEVMFVLVGPRDTGNRRVVPQELLDEWSGDGTLLYLGQREDVPALMAMSDIVAAPSYYREGVPRVLLEAAAMAKGLIATDMPGLRDVVSHGENGILIPPRDAGSLARAVMELLRDKDLRSQYGLASLERARKEFDSRKVVVAYVDLYESLWALSNN